MVKSKGLGKGLGALFGNGNFSSAQSEKPPVEKAVAKKTVAKKAVSKKTVSKKTLDEKMVEEKTASKEKVLPKETALTTEKYQMISLEKIIPNPKQPRTKFYEESLAELAESIKNSGIIQPLILRPQADGSYFIIAGERRFRASKLAGLKEVPAVLRTLDDSELLKQALIENIQREDLNILDEALALQNLKEEHGFTQERLAEVTGKPRSSIANTLNVLHLPALTKEALKENRLHFGHAKLLHGLATEEEQLFWTEQILQKAFSVRQAEEAIKKWKETPEKKEKLSVKAEEDASVAMYVKAIEEKLIASLQTKVRLQHKGEEGEIKIFYYSNEELNELLEKFHIKL